MAKAYLTLRGEGRAELVVKKSKFIASAFPAFTEDQAQQAIERVRKGFWNASHNVYAFVVGENDDIVRSSDDGEPSGTAGRPVLEVIRREGVRCCSVVVTRYFGGVLLGAAGLVRAYSAAARDGLHAAGIGLMRPMLSVRFSIDYPALGKVQNFLTGEGFSVQDIGYAERVTITVMLPSDDIGRFEARMRDLLHGAFEPEIGKETMVFAPAGS